MARTDARNATRFWRDPRTPGLSLMCADLTTQDFARHAHQALVIAVTEAGGAEVTSRGVTERARPGLLLAFDPAEPHAARMGDSRHWRYRSFYLTRPALDAVADRLGLRSVPHLRRNGIDDPDLARRFLALHRALEQGSHALAGQEQLIGSFGALFARHADGRAAGTGDDVAVRAVLALMHDRYADDLSLDDLALPAGLTPWQLIRAFKRTVGLTPHACLTQVRLNAACRRLRRGMAIADVAAEVGFYDQAALTRHFKRCYAITPRQFARAAA
jgi:AraC-like DNA-binding protein